MLTIEASSIVMNVPTATKANVAHGLLGSCRAVASHCDGVEPSRIVKNDRAFDGCQLANEQVALGCAIQGIGWELGEA